MPTNEDLRQRAERLRLYGLLAHWAEARDAGWAASLLDWEESERARRRGGRRESNWPAGDLNGPPVGRLNACEDLHQRRFTSAVGSHERHHFATIQSNRNAVEHQRTAETFRDVPRRDDG